MEDYKKIIEKIKPELEKAVQFFEKEIAKMHAGRTTPALVEDVIIDCFGEKFPLKQLAAISVPEPRKIIIQPWDQSYAEGIVAGLIKANLGASPIVEKELIRINLPELSQDYRESIIKVLSTKKEETRITIKRWREQAWSEIQDKFREKLIKEDDKFRAKDELQELIDEYNEKIDKITERKKQEIMNN
ncbi:MAG: ribosome-recycling factor [Candidatus Pacebacteria bacterium]|nr:ribosome-recycling factor [Candidatus Paceibacterota bacterium]